MLNKVLLIALLILFSGCAAYQVQECPVGVMHINVVDHEEMGRLQRQYCDQDGKLCGGRVLAFYITKTRTAYCTDVETCVHEFLHYCDSDWGHFGESGAIDVRIDK